MTFLGEPYTQEVMSMDGATILRVKAALTEYLHEFDGGMGRVANRGRLTAHVTG